MKLIIYRTAKFITRDKLKANPHVLYIFGDNMLRRGLGGQAKEMRGEPNAIGVVTKREPNNKPTSFIYDTDKDIDFVKSCIDSDIERVKLLLKTRGYKALVIPVIGVGKARLPQNAPELFKYLQTKLGELDN